MRKRTRSANPRFDRTTGRSGRLPLTLIDASTRANIARDLAALAAAIHFRRPCYAQLLQRVARQIEDGYDAAGAVANYTTTPAANGVFTEVSLSEVTLSEVTLTETNPSDHLGP